MGSPEPSAFQMRNVPSAEEIRTHGEHHAQGRSGIVGDLGEPMTINMASQPEDTTASGIPPVPTGIAGLDEILRGGLPRGDLHLLLGSAGTGKTTLALQFLLTGVAAGEIGLYITLAQTPKWLEAIAQSHGWSLSGLIVHELSPAGLAVQQTVLHTDEVELGELTEGLRQVVENVKPRRLVFDSISILFMLSGSRTRYYQELTRLREFLAGRCTSLFLGDSNTEVEERSSGSGLDTLATSVIVLDQSAPDYGDVRRRVRVVKVRGVEFQSGYHNFRIRTGGLQVYPRLGSLGVPYTAFHPYDSGIGPLDELLGGGLEKGTTCLIMGPSGSGKSTMAAVYARAVAEAGERTAIFLFDEREETWTARSEGIGLKIADHIAGGRLVFDEVETSRVTPGEFAQQVRSAVDAGAKVVVIDSLTGYFNAMANAPMLVIQMHELLRYLSRRGVLTIVLVSQEGILSVKQSILDISYLSDTILLLRFYEDRGTVHRCLSAVKKRHGEHETTIRELLIRTGSVDVGATPLINFRRILSGEPERLGDEPSDAEKRELPT